MIALTLIVWMALNVAFVAAVHFGHQYQDRRTVGRRLRAVGRRREDTNDS